MHAQQNHVWVIILGSLLSLQLAGCAANVGKSVKVSDEKLIKYDALSAADAIAALEKRINDAKNDNMPFLAPNYFREASEILTNAQKSPDKKPKNELIGDIAKADAILDKGQTMMAIVQSRLVNELALKDQLDKDNVAKVYPNEYEKSLSELSSLIEKVELEKPDNLDKDKIELIKMMQALDIKAIQYTALHESEVINEVTHSKDGEKLAPATLADALRVYQDAKNRIAQTPHDEASVKLAGDEALFAARHAHHVSERVLALQNRFKESIEPIVLEEEKRLFNISTALGYKDPRDQPIEKQAEEITVAAGEIVQGQLKAKQASESANDQGKFLEMRIQEADDALKLANAQLAEKNALLTEKDAKLAEQDEKLAEQDAQLKILNDQIAQLEVQNKSLSEAKPAKTKASK